MDSLDDEEELTHFLAFHPVASELPMLSRWDPAGRPWCQTPDEIEWIAAEVQRALLQIEPGSQTGEMLEQLLGLARRAMAENLLMEVAPD
ncbi:hypothetical protein ACUN7V_17125 [Quadrisphaera oryzae]|uniref:hypothetical protein n=1 Tax=Quadrisphaera TaxID=317661 RepID=UPI0016474AA5|nr:hypothetical protein [Quadrisphaera sp. RL12-1S]MBC3761822.1 hypothetical protein [Quadrisphaera sp. RL12-1S]